MSELFLNLFNRAVAAGWLVLAVLLLRLVLKKAPRWIHCSLWGLVGLRLVWPFSVESMLSLLPSREVLPPSVLYNPAPTVQSGIGAINAVVNGSFTPAMTATPGASVNPLQVWTWLVGWIWLLGAAALLGYGLFSYVRLRKRVAVSVEENGLYRCDAIGSPFILGIFRPKIYVPSDLDPETLPYVLAHEQAHLQRKDHWWKPLGYLLLTVFWFHPLLWLAYILLCRDIERACDERVIRSMDGAGRKAYSMALVDCAADRRAIAACPVAFGETGVKQRVWSVLHYQKPAFWLVVLAVVLSIAAAVCFLTDPVGFQLDFAVEDIAQATTMDLRMNAGPVTGELNKAQQEELWFRLRDLKQTKRRDDYGGFTPFYSMSIQLDDGTWVRIQGYALDGSMVDLVWEDTVYQVQDPEFRAYLERICSGGDRAEASLGGAWYSSDCIYMNPLSSTMATENSGFYYYVSEGIFVMGHRRTMKERRIESIDWNWQELPWSDAEWSEKFWETPVDLSGYTDRKYQPLDLEHYLLQLDGRLWLVEDHGDDRLGIWSSYELRQAATLEEAQWKYMEGARQTITIQFDLDYDEIQLTCDGGALYGAYTNVNDDKLHYYGDQILYWTAAASEDAAASAAFSSPISVRQDKITVFGIPIPPLRNI